MAGCNDARLIVSCAWVVVGIWLVAQLSEFSPLSSFQDPNRPKRAMSAFFLYSQGNRTRVKEENPEASFGEIVSSSVST